MLGLLDFVTAAIFALLPFALVYSVAHGEIDCRCDEAKNTPYVYLKRLLAVTIVFWAPFVFAAVCWVEGLFFDTDHQLVSRLAMYLAWALPLAWALSLMLILNLGVAISLLLVPLAYLGGLLMMGALGWVAGLKFLGH